MIETLVARTLRQVGYAHTYLHAPLTGAKGRDYTVDDSNCGTVSHSAKLSRRRIFPPGKPSRGPFLLRRRFYYYFNDVVVVVAVVVATVVVATVVVATVVAVVGLLSCNCRTTIIFSCRNTVDVIFILYSRLLLTFFHLYCIN